MLRVDFYELPDEGSEVVAESFINRDGVVQNTSGEQVTDEYVTPDRARQFAEAWGSRLVDVGPKGHINSASGLGMWPEGFALVEEVASPGR